MRKPKDRKTTPERLAVLFGAEAADPDLCDRCHQAPAEVGFFCKPCAAPYRRRARR